MTEQFFTLQKLTLAIGRETGFVPADFLETSRHVLAVLKYLDKLTIITQEDGEINQNAELSFEIIKEVLHELEKQSKYSGIYHRVIRTLSE